LKVSATAWRTASAAVLGVIGVWVLYTFPPVTSGFYPQCMFRQLTGLDCPGCGTTRALHAMLHGRFAEAFRFNPLLFAMAFVGSLGIPSYLRGQTPRFFYARWFGWTCFVVVAGWWVVRNIYHW
jgi:hypothetical protein